MITVKGLCKRYGDFLAVDGVDLEVARGEVFGLVGPNGAGKSTLLKSLLGIVRPTAGHCTIDGCAVDLDPVGARRRTGYLPSEGRFYETLTGRDFLAFALAGYEKLDTDLFARLVDAFALPLRNRIRTYSHGMKRKLGIVQAVVPAVPVAVLDEPEEGLDPTARRTFLELLVQLRSRGKTILLSSHHLESVSRVCDRVAFLAAGKLVDCDSMDRIRERAGRCIRVRLRAGVDPSCLRMPGVSQVLERDGEQTVVCDGAPEEVLRGLAALPLDGLEFRRLRLEEVYADLYRIDRAS